MTESKPVSKSIPNQIWLILILLNLGLILSIINSQILKKQNKSNAATQFPTETVVNSPTITFSSTLTPTQKSTSSNEIVVDYSGKELFFFSSNPTGIYQIYAFSPGILPITQLFNDKFEKMHPKINSEKTKIAYSAKKNGYWDIFIFDFINQTELQLTDTPEYEGNPEWAPDDLFIAYESYKDSNLDIFIQSLENINDPPLQLTDSPAADYAPSWSPNGREIAFVSTRTGEDEIWSARLDNIENRFKNLSESPDKSNQSPTWSADGNHVVWTSDIDGYPILQKYKLGSTYPGFVEISEGSFPIWSENELYYVQQSANSNFLTSRNMENNSVGIPSIFIPGQINGFSLLKMNAIHEQFVYDLINDNEKHLSNSVNCFQDNNQTSEISLKALSDVEAPYPYLIDQVTNSFLELKKQVSNNIGWEFLYSLDNAFSPITDPLNPGNDQDWIFTGRAFEFNPLTLYADLVSIVKEERNGQIYWRIYLKTRYQDGSQGIPLKQIPWNLSTRYADDSSNYEIGGNRTTIPDGYWFDFTALAQSLGWERQSALSNWKTYFSGARYNQFVCKSGLDWYSAMIQIYPLEAIQPPTPLPSATITPSLTPTIRYYRSPTATLTPTETLIPTRRPTWTPSP